VAAPRQQLRFGLLGPVRGWLGGAELELGPPRQRALLALLLAHAGQPVTLTTIVDVLWGTEPPRSAVNVVHRHVGMLRRIFEPGLPARAAGRRLVRGAGGYRLDADEVDLLRFRELAAAASRARDADPERALRLLVEAAGLWRGPAAAGTDPAARAHPVFVALDAEHLAAVRDAADAALAACAPEPVLPALRRAAADHPLDEPLAARLIAVLSAAGHQAEALDAYQITRTALADDLGIDPGPDLRTAHDHVLHQQIPPSPSGAAALAAPAAGTGPVVGGGPAEGAPAGAGAEVARAAAGGAVRPAQLPADLVAFAGRGRELAELVGLLPDVDAGPVVGVISGRAGIGKTALAVRWAHRVADRFPDGQLHVDLRGFDPDGDSAVEPAEALRGFLDALGVPAGRMPTGPAALTALYRGVLTGRRVLVLLDNARDASQARPLLPASRGCLAIVTSRDDLAGLVATDGAHPVALATLSPGAARDLLSHRLGTARLAAEPAAAADLLSACAGLPLALAVVAARAAAHPALTLTSIATDLRHQPSAPDTSAPDAPGTARTVFSWSWRGLGEPARELFPLLALHSGPSSVAAAASLAGVPASRVRGSLEELTRSSLLTEQAPGRYALHDLLRAYAGELAERHQPPAELAAARRRLLDHQVATALQANRLIDPLGQPVPAVAAGPGVTAGQLDGTAGAYGWFTAEHRNLLDAVRGALRDGLDRHVESLAGALQPYLERTGRWPDWVAAAGAALTAAQRRGDRAAEATAHQRLGLANRAQRRHREALRHLRAALERQTDPTGQAYTHRMIAMVLTDQGHVPEALRHNRRALGLYRAAGNRRGEGVALNELGWHHGLLGQYRAGVTYCTEAERLLRGLDDPVGRGAALDSLGYLHRRLGDTHAAAGNTAAARAAWRQALAILTELGHPDTRQLLERLATPAERDRVTGS
jgi:DNA-binding SARP family transcriptional activator/tetratricopeptide (TPR) repeat protein